MRAATATQQRPAGSSWRVENVFILFLFLASKFHEKEETRADWFVTRRVPGIEARADRRRCAGAERGDGAVGAVVLTEAARDLARVDPQRQLQGQTQLRGDQARLQCCSLLPIRARNRLGQTR